MKFNSFNFKNKSKGKRLGRGIGSGKGKTSGRGHKGQKSRSGVAIKSFEGGQMPLYRRLPKRGFSSLKKDRKMAILNLVDLQKNFEKKIINSTDKITLDNLKRKKIINKKYEMLKILGVGEIKEKFQIEANKISKSARDKVKKIGGNIILLTK